MSMPDGYIPLPIASLPPNRALPFGIHIYMATSSKMLLFLDVGTVLTHAKHQRMIDFQDRFFLRAEDEALLKKFLAAEPSAEGPVTQLIGEAGILASAKTKEELQLRSSEVLFKHFGITLDPTSKLTPVQQVQGHINAVAADVMQVLEVDGGILERIKSLLKSAETSSWNHAANVAAIATLLALSAGYTDRKLLRDIAVGGYLHDVGLASVGLSTLRRGQTYNDIEMEFYRRHPMAGLEMIEIMQLEVSDDVKLIVYQHEEKYDGGGYPENISGSDIFEPAQIVALASALDQLIRVDAPGFIRIEDAMIKLGEDNCKPGEPAVYNPILVNQIFDTAFKAGTISMG